MDITVTGVNVNEDSLEKLKGLQITPLDDDDEEQESMVVDEDEFDDDEDDEEREPVTLGFIEKPKKPWSLLRQLFPHKAGGVPAWLNPVDLPSGRFCLCDFCGEPLQFLLQVYAPISDKDPTFHRTLFLFMCPSMSCLLRDQHEQWKRPPEKALRSVKVFRCQLPRVNPFYSGDPPIHDGTDKPLSAGAPLCSWCGTWKGDKVCSSCKKERYCSQKHQAKHWQSGHRIECKQLSLSVELLNSDLASRGTMSSETHKGVCKSLWPEFELVNVDESEYDEELSEDNGVNNSLISMCKADDKLQSEMKSFEADDEKQSWASFQEHIFNAPEQVLRYCLSSTAKPLWPMSSGRASKADIPKCSHCCGPRCFEFQVLPQLLYFFGVKNEVDSLDWATIVVYTCEDSCEGGVSYKEEFAWVQLNS